MTQKCSCKQDPKELKGEVALVLEQRYSVPEARLIIGYRSEHLYKWQELHEQQAEGKTFPENECEELKRVRKEVENYGWRKSFKKKPVSSSRKK